MSNFTTALTFHLLVKCSSEKDRETQHPLLLADKAVAVLIEGPEDAVHEIVVTHGEVVVEDVTKLDAVQLPIWAQAAILVQQPLNLFLAN